MDNGLGIPVEVRTRIFDTFYMTKPIGKGTGMGLSISYSIISQKHHDDLSCRSIVSQGSEFIVQIPVVAGASKKSTSSSEHEVREKVENR
nr:ATP-binding protein [Synechococcus sp. PCC 7335]